MHGEKGHRICILNIIEILKAHFFLNYIIIYKIKKTSQIQIMNVFANSLNSSRF